MTRVAETRVSLLLAAVPGSRDTLAVRAEKLARGWAGAVDADTALCCRVRDAAADFRGTHFAALVPDLAAFDVAIDAWCDGDRPPDVAALTETTDVLGDALDRERSLVLAGRQARFFGDGAGPVVLDYLLRRRLGLDRDAFVRYWREEHSGLRLPRFSGYLQLVVDPALTQLLSAGTGLPAASFDGMAEASYEDLAHFRRVSTDPAVAELAAADERRFLDHGSCAAAVSCRVWSG